MHLLHYLAGIDERYRYEEGEELVHWLREQAENFDYDAMHRRLEEFLKYKA
ncbi:MAG: hypothetical protein LBL64_08040 [Treponema sp.]|jgi:hypothetical protein|nr:hypothetical protein [Treponema sp.]